MRSKTTSTRRTRSVIMAVALLSLGFALTAVATNGDPNITVPPSDGTGAGAEEDGGSGPAEIETVAVEKRDLIRQDDFDAVIGHETATEMVSRLEGTVTDLPDAGDTIAPGEVLFEVDERPIYLLKGATPMWRDLNSSVEDGNDVRQLERALVDLGFGEDVTVDEEWTWYTTSALQDWEESLGLDEDGELLLGEIIFAPGPIRVEEVTAALGGSSAGAIAQITETHQIVETAIDPGDVDVLPVNAKVEVELPDETTVRATVTKVGGVADDNGDLPASLILDKPVDLADGTSVEVVVDQTVAKDVKTVPVTALVALLEGGHAVEVVADDGSTNLVPVELGNVVDGWVEITGKVQAGAEVVTA